MEKIKLDIVGISSSQTQSGAYALILAESDGKRRLPIIIGAFEAQAIAIELEHMKPQRPLTHDLFLSFSHAHSIDIKEVVINKFAEGIFFAELVAFDGNEERRIDARTSDAVALALRFRCPVYTISDVMDKAGILMDDLPREDEGDGEGVDEKEGELSNLSVHELEELLNEAVKTENFEKASQLRDEINRRKK